MITLISFKVYSLIKGFWSLWVPEGDALLRSQATQPGHPTKRPDDPVILLMI